MKLIKTNNVNRKYILISAVVVILVIGGALLKNKYTNQRGVEINNSQSGTSENAEEEKPLASMDLNTMYVFTARDAQGNPASNLNFKITKAEKVKEVLVQGRPANAKGDRAFLVLHIEIDNAETRKLYIAPVDLLRTVEESGKLFAPDIHSDLVEIQPLSTKITRVGFVVAETQSRFMLQIGELEGDKQSLEINFN